jgi:nucleoside-diphosphate-sugar epimerase
MMQGKTIVVTGVTGQIAFPMAAYLAEHNDVYGVARFSAPGSIERAEAAGIRPVVCDLGVAVFDGVPAEPDGLVHLAVSQVPGLDYDGAMRTNAEGTGLLLQHCRGAVAAVVLSTHSVYKPHADPLHVFVETDPLGDPNPSHAPTYGISKLGQEAVARTCARLFGLPITIARMNASYGNNGGLPMIHMRMLAEGLPVTTRWAPCPYQPIHEDDINAQVEGLLAAATTPATIMNWAGDEVVSAQEWCAYMGELLGVDPVVNVVETPGTLRGSIADVTKRLAATGPCQVPWKVGMARAVEAHLAAQE